MLQVKYQYPAIIKNSEQIAWRIEDILPEDSKFDFRRPFLPESLASTEELKFLTDNERLLLNQISGNTYLNLFQFVEEFILTTAMEHAHEEIAEDDQAVRGLLRFAEEEIKHQQLFKRFRKVFDRDFGHPCQVLDNADEVAAFVLENNHVAVLMLIYHIEIMTQAHYIHSVKDNRHLDPLFANLLRAHWLEEAQHAKMDLIELDKTLDAAEESEVAEALDVYFAILDAFDNLLKRQATMDAESLDAVLRQKGLRPALKEKELQAVTKNQLKSLRSTFLRAGMDHTAFREVLQQISPKWPERTDRKSAVFAAAA